MKRWEQLEKSVARLTGGERVPGSGNGPRKGDVESPVFLCECKETGQKKFSLQVTWLDEVWTDARRVNKLPLFVAEFGTGARLYLMGSSFCGPEDSSSVDPGQSLDVLLDWSQKKTITLSPGDTLLEGRFIKTGQRYWKIVSEETVRALAMP